MKKVGIKGYKGISRLRMWLQLKIFAKYYDAFCVTSLNKSKNICESFLLDCDKVKPLGQPRNDLLFKKNDRNDILSKIYNKLPEYKYILLYAPTYRTSQYGNARLKPTKFFPFYDFNRNGLEEFLDQEKILLLVRPPPLEKIEFSESSRIKFIDSNRIDEITEILNIFDLLITDYSAIAFDFLILNRPLIFLSYDEVEYTQEVGIAYEYDLVSPGPKPNNQNDFIKELLLSLKNKSYFLKERQKAINFLYTETTLHNGNCKRIVDFINYSVSRYSNE